MISIHSIPIQFVSSQALHRYKIQSNGHWTWTKRNLKLLHSTCICCVLRYLSSHSSCRHCALGPRGLCSGHWHLTSWHSHLFCDAGLQRLLAAWAALGQLSPDSGSRRDYPHEMAASSHSVSLIKTQLSLCFMLRMVINFLKDKRFLAPSGSQGVAISICLSVTTLIVWLDHSNINNIANIFKLLSQIPLSSPSALSQLSEHTS